MKRKKDRERERERERLAASHMHPDGTGPEPQPEHVMCPDQQWNWHSLGVQDNAQLTKLLVQG